MVKVRVSEYGLAPAEFDALTRQKYFVPFTRPVTDLDVKVSPFWSRTGVAKSDVVDTCKRYDSAPLSVFQLSVGDRETFSSLSGGKFSAGPTVRIGTVVKLLERDQAPAPPAFIPLTRQ